MKAKHCEATRLQQLLENRLSSVEEEQLSAHLDTCSRCRERLEALAASPHQWHQARHLADGPTSPSKNAEATRTFLLSAEGETDLDVDPPAAGPLSFLGPTDDPAMLGRLGPYEVMGVIGEGGMGIVLKAFDRALARNVAIKVLAPQLAAGAVARRRFAREAQAAAAVVHEHVIAIHAVAEYNGLPYLVMPYVPGQSLQQRIDKTGPLTPAEVLRIASQAAAGLAAAHAQGLVHRDVKPANILLENGVERVTLTDFGLARTVDDASLTCTGIVAGTPQYMSPEQARGEALDHRADLFSLGSVMYAMCTGRPPFRAEGAIAVLRRISEDRPRPIREINPEIPPWLADIIAKLHAKDPAQRFQSAGEVSELLERCLAHLQNPTVNPLPRPLRGLQVRRLVRDSIHSRPHRLRLLAAGLLLALSLTGGYWAYRTTESARGARAQAARPEGVSVRQPAAGSVDLTGWNAAASRIQQSSVLIHSAWSHVPGETWPEAEEIPRLRARARELRGELTGGAF